MEAFARAFHFIEDLPVLQIPFFQRSYVWKEENWAALLESVRQEKKPYLGSLILKDVTRSSGDIRTFLVIDGQQRLTTLSILLKALSDVMSPDEVPSKIAEHLFTERDEWPERKVKIRHSIGDEKAYRFVMESMYDQIVSAKLNSRICDCYEYFYNELSNIHDEQALKKIRSRLVNGDEKIWVVIDLKDEDSEQAIFDTINSAGVRLTCADMIKNTLFQTAIQLAGEVHREDVISNYRKYWAGVFEIDEESEFWQDEAQAIRVKRTNLEMFLHSYAVVRNFFDIRTDRLEDLHDIYKHHLDTMSYQQVIEFIIDLSKVSKVYKERIRAVPDSEQLKYDDYEERLLKILDQCNVTTFYPYLLHLFTRYAPDSNELKMKLQRLETFVMRRYIAKESTRQYNDFCARFIADDSVVSELDQRIPDSAVESKLRVIDNRRATVVLFWIELWRRKEDVMMSEKGLPFGYSLEHILPQSWKTYWSDVPVRDEAGEVVVDQEAATQIRNMKCYEIGNMTLLNKRMNASVRNYELRRKISGDPNGKGNAKRGFKDISDMKITKDDIIRPFESNPDFVWDELAITKRTTEMIRYFKEIWPSASSM